MRRCCVVVSAVAAAITVVTGISLLTMAQRRPQASPPAIGIVKPRPPEQPTHGPGGREIHFDGVTAIKQMPPGEVVADHWLFVPDDHSPGTPAAPEPLPAIIFAHSHTIRDPVYYQDWIDHLVRHGAVVIYTEFQEDSEDFEVYRQNLLDDVRGALGLMKQGGIPIDLERVAVVGHSVGGMLAVDCAARAPSADLPEPAAVLAAAPGCDCQLTGLEAIPATTHLLLVLAADDADPTGGGAVAQSWNGLGTVPLERRDIVTVVSDTHGSPWLLATHEQAQAATPDEATYAAMASNPLDWYGTWKWLDALMGCAFDGEWCEYAFGNTTEQRFMGMWSDGVAVTEAKVADDLE